MTASAAPRSSSATYRTWTAMRARCAIHSASRYPRYGGRGIRVCARWLESFDNFLADMGERPAGMSIDRIDNDGNYEPSNCRWATRKEQCSNRPNLPPPSRKAPRCAYSPDPLLVSTIPRDGWAVVDALFGDRA